MYCSEFDILLSDYVDGTLAGPARVALDEHAAECAECRQTMADVLDGVSLLRRAETVEPPAELITRIVFQSPAGRNDVVRSVRQDEGRVAGWIRGIRDGARQALRQTVQPKFAMGMAMTILSFSMLERCTGVRLQHVQPADLQPVRVWNNLEDRVMRSRDRAVKYYENLRVVYEVERQLRAFREQEDRDAKDAAAVEALKDGKK